MLVNGNIVVMEIVRSVILVLYVKRLLIMVVRFYYFRN